MATVTVFQYDMFICEGFNDLIHGGGETIQEIFIPSHKIILNSKGAIFNSEYPRNSLGPRVKPLKEIQISLELVEKISLIAKLKQDAETKEKELESELKNLWK